MKKWRPLFFARRSLRVDLLTAFGGLLMGTVLVVIFYFYYNSTQMVLTLCDDLMEQTTQAVINRTASFLTPVTAMTEMSSQAAASGVLPFGNTAQMERYAFEALNAYPTAARFLFGDQAGNFLMATRLPDGNTSTKIMDRTTDPPLTTWRIRDKTFNLIKTETSVTDTFDPRLRPWYQGAKANQRLYLTDVYVFYTGRVPGVTVSYPVLDSQGMIVGVIGCDIELSGLSTFLKSLRIGNHGLALIINERNELVAFPDADRIIDNQVEHGVLRTVHIENLGVPSISAAFRKYRTSGAARVTVEAGGKEYLATFRDFPASFEKPWKVIVVVPEDDFIGDVKKINHGVFLICMAILAVATILVVFLSRSISKPILLLTAETDRIRNFQLDGQFHLQTPIYEIQQLQGAMDRMKASLRSFTRFAPEQIVREVVVKGEEAMLGGERREVTLLFSDLRNFTRFSERTRPEQVVKILNTHFDAMVKIITQHHGFVVDFLGDSLFAVFGAPGRDPDHARQAVSCAIDMQLARQQMNSDLAGASLPVMEMGIGVNSGPCVVGNMGSRMRIKYGVVGHAVNLASRLESFTVGGQVLISESTYQAVADQLEVAGPIEANAKGVESAIRLWEVRGIHNDENKSLPPTLPRLHDLVTPIPVRIRLILGKQINPSPHEGRLVQLSSTGAQLETKLSLEVFASVQVEIPGLLGKDVLIDVKVVSMGRDEHSYIIKFSELDEAGATAVNLWLIQG
jgi:adenylate cyclase